MTQSRERRYRTLSQPDVAGQRVDNAPEWFRFRVGFDMLGI